MRAIKRRIYRAVNAVVYANPIVWLTLVGVVTVAAVLVLALNITVAPVTP